MFPLPEKAFHNELCQSLLKMPDEIFSMLKILINSGFVLSKRTGYSL